MSTIARVPAPFTGRGINNTRVTMTLPVAGEAFRWVASDADPGAMSAWTDRVTGATLTQATTANRPVTAVDTGRAAATMTDAQNIATVSAPAGLPSATSVHTMYAVCRAAVAAPAATGAIAQLGGTGFVQSTDGKIKVPSGAFLTGPAALTVPFIATGVFNGSSSVIGVNETEVTGAIGAVSANSGVALGASWAGSIFELVIYPGVAHSLSQRKAIRGALKAWHGIA